MAGKNDSQRPFWIATEGGPAVLVPKASLMAWAGAEPPRVDGRPITAETADGPVPPSDYERARAVEGPCGVLDVGGRDALVLAAAPVATTWKSLPEGVLLVRVRAAEERRPSLPAASMLRALVWEPPRAELVSAQSSWLLFDAADTGWELYASCAVSISPGRYEVAHGAHPSPRVALSAVRLTRVANR